VIRVRIALSALFLILAVSACGGVKEELPSQQAPVKGESSSTPGSPLDMVLLTDGEFLDSKPIEGTHHASGTIIPLPQAARRATAIVIVEVTAIADAQDYTSSLRDSDGKVFLESVISPITTYRASVQQWVKGTGPDEILIAWWGGGTPDGLDFYDGGFLPQVGRKYLLLLSRKSPDLPGPGEYETAGDAGYEVTDGRVHVVNNPLWQDLQAKYGGMPVGDFVAVLQGFLAATPEPSATPAKTAGPVATIAP
jgi:hypothetical protein